MYKKRKYLYALFAFMIAALICIPQTLQMRTQAAAKPGTVKLSSIKAVDYNKINIKWKKPSGKFTNYCIYYREKNSNGKWIRIKTVNNKTLSYTHTSSAKYPIVTGETYQYTVRAYNKKPKRYGNYNKSGLTTKTKPQQVKLTGISYDEDEGVTITWNKAGGAYLYRVYCKSKDNTTVTPTPALTMQQMADEVVRLANIERAKIGFAPLKTNVNLQRAAMVRAQEISIKFSHIRPNGTDASTACYEAGAGCAGGENIAKGFSTPQDVMTGWMNSDGHRWAILDSGYTHVGVGVYKIGNDLYCWTMEFSDGPDRKCNVIVYANGGKFDDGLESYSMQVPYGSRIDAKTLKIPTREGYHIKGWSETANGNNMFTSGCTNGLERAFTAYAIWESNS